MTTEKTILDEWAVKDLEDGSSLSITVVHCPELGNQSLSGIQVLYMGNIVNFEPGIVERWGRIRPPKRVSRSICSKTNPGWCMRISS